MDVEIGCPGCGRRLRVAEEHAGKQIRCPACQQVCVAPGERVREHLTNHATKSTDYGTPTRSAGAPVPTTDAARWHVRMPDGPIYGPIGWEEVLAWAAEGRIAADCELAESAGGPWRQVGELIPSLARVEQAAPAPAEPTTYPWTAAANVPVGGYQAAHRGGLVLVLGLLGFMGCPLISFMAWIMGSHDLHEMRAGRMDRSGESPTLAGMVLGMIVSILWLCGLGLTALVLLIVAWANM